MLQWRHNLALVEGSGIVTPDCNRPKGTAADGQIDISRGGVEAPADVDGLTHAGLRALLKPGAPKIRNVATNQVE